MWNEGVGADAIFLADYAINPLGVKSDSAIAEVVSSWLERAVTVSDTLVIACNTLSIRFEQLREIDLAGTPALKVVSMVDCFEALVRLEADQLANKKVLVVGTAFTAKQPLHAQILDRVIPGVRVDTIGATELERKIARFEPWKGVADPAITAELKRAIGSSDIAILACTCFPMVKTDLEALFPDVVFLDPGAYCPALIEGHHTPGRKRLAIEVTGDQMPAASVISFAGSYLDEGSIDLHRSQ